MPNIFKNHNLRIQLFKTSNNEIKKDALGIADTYLKQVQRSKFRSKRFPTNIELPEKFN